MTNMVRLRHKTIIYAASDDYGDLVRCERCEKKIRVGQPIVRWKEGIRTHEECK